MEVNWAGRYAQRMRGIKSSAVRELLKLTEQPDVISFAGGLPAPGAFPVAEIADAAQRILTQAGPTALQYGATEGYTPLRQLIAEQMRADGITVSAENVLITTGSQQALDLLGKVFLDPGDRVLVESPTYLAALQAWRTYGAEFVPVAADGDGICTDALATALEGRGAKFLYSQPTFQNPTGVTLPLERREAIVALAAQHGVPIVEDDPYGMLRFEGERLPRLIAQAAKRATSTRRASMQSKTGAVVYMGTCSKVLAPGLRVGWVVAEAEVIARLTLAKQSADLHTASLNQMLVYELWHSGAMERHTPTIVDMYRERRNAMLTALSEHFPPGVRWTKPQGGMFLWVTLPQTLDATDLLSDALAEKVAFVPGEAFYIDGSGRNTLRLNFSNATSERIHEGIARLGRTLDARLAVIATAGVK
ncbi:MAG TPA: PLP-dependent aminotransferase family protein [Ktedonobacterales bacterium]